MLKVALVGVGGISGAHIPAWLTMEDVELVALCDIRPEQMEKYPQIRHYTEFDCMLEQEQIDILDICLPTYLHADFAVKAMEKGIHVLCEKPLSLQEADVGRVYAAAQAAGVKVMAAQVIRFWPEYEYLKAVCDSGRYGRLLSGSMSRLGAIPGTTWDNWMHDEKRSGLVPYDLHIHDLDFLVYAFGAPNKATAHRAKRPDQDYLCAVYEYDDFFVTVDASWFASPYPFRMSFRFQFEQAIIAYEDNVLTVYERSGKIFQPAKAADCANQAEYTLPATNAYAEEIRYFTDCVKYDRPVKRVTPESLETVIHLLGTL
ncbi:MAG: Gfo/Idh/MocA family oxidoreductase [Clostridia bacterium]|nr:Gfo/Idh/MocA family oxidoreductase [Clostridia bacterium]